MKNQSGAECIALLLIASGTLYAQEANPTARPDEPQQQQQQVQQAVIGPDNTPLYRVTVVGRVIPAINYFHRSDSTKIGFQGTSLMPGAKGEARVNAHAGRTSIDVDIRGLSPANGFGQEYLTYVLWAITPEGRPVNLGEVLPSGGSDRMKMTVTTNLQAFGLIVTAEPYYAVTMPSDVVVMQNVVLEDKTQGVIEPVNAHYTLLPRGAYTETAGRHSVLRPITRNERSPLELYEAENAVGIASAAGADKYAADTMVTAKTALKNAEDIDAGKNRDRKQTITYAREAVQAAEDARIITIRKLKAEDEAADKAAAQQAQLAAEQQAAERQAADARARSAREAAEAAEQRAREAQAAQQQAEQSAQNAQKQAEETRERLKSQLNQVLQTTESARGLIVNMSDVLFDFNKYTLKPEAREKLAKVSGILVAYPSLKLQVEGYTDNIGSDEYNQKLSEERAGTVKDYLVSQSVQEDNVSAAGYGKTHPIADNNSSSGRAQNRRVQLVVSGAAIGVQEGTPGASLDQAPGTGEGTGTPSTAPETQGGMTGTSTPPQ